MSAEIATLDPHETITLESPEPGVIGLTLWHIEPGAIPARLAAVRLAPEHLGELAERVAELGDDVLNLAGRISSPLYAALRGERYGSVHGRRDEHDRGSAGDIRPTVAEQLAAMAARYVPAEGVLCGEQFTPLGLHETEPCVREPGHAGRHLGPAQWPEVDDTVYPPAADDVLTGAPAFTYPGPTALVDGLDDEDPRVELGELAVAEVLHVDDREGVYRS